MSKNKKPPFGDTPFYRLLFDDAPVGLALCDMDGSYLAVNKEFAKILGRTPEETLKLSYWEITPESYKDQEVEQLELVKKQGWYGPYYKEYVHTDGSHVPVRLEGHLITYDGSSFIWSQVEDINSRKFKGLFHEGPTPLSMDAFHKLFDEAPAGLALCDMTGSYIAVNRAFADILGRTPSETLKLSYWEITPKSYADLEDKQLQIVRKDRRYGPYYKDYIHKDGRLVPVRLKGHLIEFEGKEYIWSLVENLHEEQFRILFQDADLGLSYCDMNNGNFKDVNKRFADLVGWTEAELRTMSYYNLTPEKYRRDEVQQLQKLADEGRFGPYNKELIRRDGSLVEVSVTGLKVPIGGVDYIWSIVQKEVYGGRVADDGSRGDDGDSLRPMEPLDPKDAVARKNSPIRPTG